MIENYTTGDVLIPVVEHLIADMGVFEKNDTTQRIEPPSFYAAFPVSYNFV